MRSNTHFRVRPLPGIVTQSRTVLREPRSHDVVSAINAAIAVLQGSASPSPVSFTSKREALRVLAHYVGGIHQPLHVGAIYLDASGHEVDPDAGTYDPATKTQGGSPAHVFANANVQSAGHGYMAESCR